MARTTLAVTEITRSGIAGTLTAANAEGHTMVNDGRTLHEVVNDSGSPVDVTIQTASTISGLAVADLVVTVPAGERRLIGPLPKSTFNITSGADSGAVYIDYEAVTSVTVGAFSLP